MYLIWESSGEYTLEDYIEMEDGWVQLANDLGVKVKEEEEEAESHENDSGHQSGREKLHQKLAREVLRQLLEGMAYCHSLGVIHRDVKVNKYCARLCLFLVCQPTFLPVGCCSMQPANVLVE